MGYAGTAVAYDCDRRSVADRHPLDDGPQDICADERAPAGRRGGTGGRAGGGRRGSRGRRVDGGGTAGQRPGAAPGRGAAAAAAPAARAAARGRRAAAAGGTGGTAGGCAGAGSGARDAAAAAAGRAELQRRGRRSARGGRAAVALPLRRVQRRTIRARRATRPRTRTTRSSTTSPCHPTGSTWRRRAATAPAPPNATDSANDRVRIWRLAGNTPTLCGVDRHLESRDGTRVRRVFAERTVPRGRVEPGLRLRLQRPELLDGRIDPQLVRRALRRRLLARQPDGVQHRLRLDARGRHALRRSHERRCNHARAAGRRSRRPRGVARRGHRQHVDDRRQGVRRNDRRLRLQRHDVLRADDREHRPSTRRRGRPASIRRATCSAIGTDEGIVRFWSIPLTSTTPTGRRSTWGCRRSRRLSFSPQGTHLASPSASETDIFNVSTRAFVSRASAVDVRRFGFVLGVGRRADLRRGQLRARARLLRLTSPDHRHICSAAVVAIYRKVPDAF